MIGFLHFGMPWVALKVAERIPPPVERNASDQVVKVLERFHLDDSVLPQARQQALQAAFRGLIAHEPRAADMRLIFAAAPGHRSQRIRAAGWPHLHHRRTGRAGQVR